MKRTIFLVALCMAFLLASAIQVSSAPRSGVSLSGTYHVQGIATCVQTSFVNGGIPHPFTGFDNTFELQMPATTRTRHMEGTLVLSSDGTGTAQLRHLQINHQRINVGQYPLQEWTGVCAVEYASQPDGTATMTFTNCAGTYLDGGSGLLVDSGSPGPRTYNLVVSKSGELLFLSQTEISYPPEVSWQGSEGNGTYSEGERECARTVTGVLIGR